MENRGALINGEHSEDHGNRDGIEKYLAGGLNLPQTDPHSVGEEADQLLKPQSPALYKRLSSISRTFTVQKHFGRGLRYLWIPSLCEVVLQIVAGGRHSLQIAHSA